MFASAWLRWANFVAGAGEITRAVEVYDRKTNFMKMLMFFDASAVVKLIYFEQLIFEWRDICEGDLRKLSFFQIFQMEILLLCLYQTHHDKISTLHSLNEIWILTKSQIFS